ncbi:MAG: flagellin [Maritimibacter sp.]
MSSILTNTSAMVALQTLKGINKSLEMTQSQISTGKAVATAKDNSAVWAISKVMEADVNGFKAISDSLSLGESTVAVGQKAAETVQDLLGKMKEKIVSAQNENVDRSKLQTDISALRDQINTVVGAAQFNGLNMVQGTEDVNVLASLDRSSDGTVTASNITVSRQDLSTSAGTYGSGTSLAANTTDSAAAVVNTANTATVSYTGTWTASETATVTVAGVDVTYTGSATTVTAIATGLAGSINGLGLEGITASNASGVLTISSTKAFESTSVAASDTSAAGGGTASAASIGERAEKVSFSTAAAVSEGDGYKVTIGGSSYNYIAGKNETMEDVARGLKTAIDSAGLTDITTRVVQNSTTDAWELKVDNDGSSLAFSSTGNAGGTASGGLFGLDSIDVTTNTGAATALDNIETLINNSIDAAAAFGSAAGRIEIQNDFIGSLSDALKSGIGTMVDADMEAASARLQALQVQQQLGTQALSIANQAPQNILSLFR